MLTLFVVLVIAGWRRLPFSYTLFVVSQLLAISARHNFVAPLLGTLRYVLVLFPVFIVVALLDRPRRLRYSWLITSLLLLAFMLCGYLSGWYIP